MHVHQESRTLTSQKKITGTERFEGKPTIKVPTNVCVKAPKKLIEKIENELGK